MPVLWKYPQLYEVTGETDKLTADTTTNTGHPHHWT
jgi:hypothetical protein